MSLRCTSKFCRDRFLSKHFLKSYYSLQNLTLQNDPLDTFTTELIQNKLNKWNIKKNVISENSGHYKIEPVNYESSFETLLLEEINKLFKDASEMQDENRLIALMKQCLYFEKCPSVIHIISVLKLCAHNGDKSLIHQIIKLCENFHPKFLNINSHFKEYLAEAIWVNGNISGALKLFEEVYSNNCYRRRNIVLVLKLLLTEAVNKRSEAVLIIITNFALDLSTRYEDFFLLCCIWQVCILSEWFCDQDFALKLMAKNKGVQQAVLNKIQYVVVILLHQHRTEVVYRLLQIVLEYDMKLQFDGILLALLNYESKCF